ncbi:hypothetical protein CMI47_03990 [Candidatus Pacearchaeota archaeon]|nr:hypothetical protein [Candidatus Pacearchaeota archaeon]
MSPKTRRKGGQTDRIEYLVNSLTKDWESWHSYFNFIGGTVRFKVLISFREPEKKREYLVLEYIKDVEDPVKWATELIAHFNSTLPEERHRRFHFVKIIDRKENVK